MNQRQQERVADLGRAFQDALTDIINMGEDGHAVKYDDQEPMMAEPDRMTGSVVEPNRDINHGLASNDVTITQLHNGFFVQVGCQRFVFETYDKMSKYIKLYFEDPIGMHEKHSSGELFGK